MQGRRQVKEIKRQQEQVTHPPNDALLYITLYGNQLFTAVPILDGLTIHVRNYSLSRDGNLLALAR